MMKDTGGEILGKRALSPQAISGTSAVNGVSIDRKGYSSGKFIVTAGATTGTPTSFAIAIKVQHSSDNFSTPVDVTTAENNDNAVTASVVAVNTEKVINVDFRKLHRYVRIVATPAFVGGSSPDLMIGAALALGEVYLNPAV